MEARGGLPAVLESISSLGHREVCVSGGAGVGGGEGERMERGLGHLGQGEGTLGLRAAALCQ